MKRDLDDQGLFDTIPLQWKTKTFSVEDPTSKRWEVINLKCEFSHRKCISIGVNGDILFLLLKVFSSMKFLNFLQQK